MSGRDGAFRLQNGVTVELVDTGAPFRSGALGGDGWPCLGCGERRSIEQARTVTVQQVGDPPMRRHILLCVPCLDGCEAAGGAEREPA